MYDHFLILKHSFKTTWTLSEDVCVQNKNKKHKDHHNNNMSKFNFNPSLHMLLVYYAEWSQDGADFSLQSGRDTDQTENWEWKSESYTRPVQIQIYIYIYIYYSDSPCIYSDLHLCMIHIGVPWPQKVKSCLLRKRPVLSEILTLSKHGVGQNIALHVLPTARNSALILVSAFSVCWTSFFLFLFKHKMAPNAECQSGFACDLVTCLLPWYGICSWLDVL